jgi:2-isopropylmalate synthase
MSKKILIFDTTLRDGEQVPGAKLNNIEKLEIAMQLEKLGVDIIEAGFPISSPDDLNAVKQISKTIKSSSICALARAVDKDIDTAYESIKNAVAPRIHTFVSTSDIHLMYQIKKSRDEVKEMTRHAVSYAKKYVNDVEFSPMDASRSDINFLIEIIKIAIESGATTINIPDTVGYALPTEWSKMIYTITNQIEQFNDEIVLSVHTHNDLGLATANALAGIENGARQIECTINGIGERAGNCALEEIAMIIKSRYNNQYFTNINSKEIIKTSKLASQIMGVPVQPNKAITGVNAFAHSSGIHQDGIIKHRQNFEIIDPAEVGLHESGIILTSRSGRSALKHRLDKLGYQFENTEELEKIYNKFLEIADQKKEVYDEDLQLIIDNKEIENKKQKYSLELVQVLSGNKNIPMAIVKIINNSNSQSLEGISNGTGPIDACFKAIDNALDISVNLKEFLVQAITEGIDANGKVSVQIESNGKHYYGFGTDGDIIVASAKAYIDSINKI